VRIQYASIILAPGGLLGEAFGATVNGEQVVDETEFFRAAAKAVWPGGNRTQEFSVSVWRRFGSIRAASVFCLMHYGQLPNVGQLAVYCGEPGDLQVATLNEAVLASVAIVEQRGSSVQVRYSWKGTGWNSDIVPGDDPFPDDPEEESDVTRRSTVNLPADAVTHEVTFANPLAGTPVVVPSMVIPDGGDLISCSIVKGSVSGTGFTVAFSFPIPSSEYQLSYVAIL
jgi:hypothetical protein